ncbi:MAG: hypothetical protein IJA10_15690 [Lachnospiraceae bacterium]|nr:hypothetical protein [Lachnospiraceae bacterium]
MRKTNILKVAVCTVMFTLMLGTTVFAGTYTNSANVLNKSDYQYSYTGTNGNYSATGGASSTSTLAINKTSTSKMFYCSVSRFNVGMGEYDDMDQYADVLAGNTGKIVTIDRDYDNSNYDYYHNAQAFASATSSSASTRVDNFNFTAEQ